MKKDCSGPVLALSGATQIFIQHHSLVKSINLRKGEFASIEARISRIVFEVTSPRRFGIVTAIRIHYSRSDLRRAGAQVQATPNLLVLWSLWSGRDPHHKGLLCLLYSEANDGDRSISPCFNTAKAVVSFLPLLSTCFKRNKSCDEIVFARCGQIPMTT